jgi:hypothetical protein
MLVAWYGLRKAGIIMKSTSRAVSSNKRTVPTLADWLFDVRFAIVVLLVIAVFVIYGGFNTTYKTDQDRTFGQFVADFYANGGAELLSIAITVLIIEGLNRRRSINERKRMLTLQMSSPYQGIAGEAARILAVEGWLRDGALRDAHLIGANLAETLLESADLAGALLGSANLAKAHLMEANLAGAYLMDANLAETYLYQANLAEAYFVNTNLTRADLVSANLAGAHLYQADLTGAYLEHANLAGASLENAILVGANLGNANLAGVNLEKVEFDESTNLPDRSKWTHDTDMARFTDPNHREFWQPEPDEAGHLPWWVEA